jgi:hypothetical protein
VAETVEAGKHFANDGQDQSNAFRS